MLLKWYKSVSSLSNMQEFSDLEATNIMFGAMEWKNAGI